jgi:HSP20 family protein
MFKSLFNVESSLFDEFRRMEQEMDEFFSRGPWSASIRSVERGTYPPINVGSTPEKVDVYLFAAGLSPTGFEISIQQNLLTVSGERKVPVNENVNYYRQERFNGGFRRVIALPDDVDADRVEARYRDGILHITVQRREVTKPRQIEVK